MAEHDRDNPLDIIDKYYDEATGTQHYPPSTDDNGEDTAPFDVVAFLNYLESLDKYVTIRSIHGDDIVYSTEPTDYSNVGTHYYGDDCPGQHYDEQFSQHND